MMSENPEGAAAAEEDAGSENDANSNASGNQELNESYQGADLADQVSSAQIHAGQDIADAGQNLAGQSQEQLDSCDGLGDRFASDYTVDGENATPKEKLTETAASALGEIVEMHCEVADARTAGFGTVAGETLTSFGSASEHVGHALHSLSEGNFVGVGQDAAGIFGDTTGWTVKSLLIMGGAEAQVLFEKAEGFIETGETVINGTFDTLASIDLDKLGDHDSSPASASSSELIDD